MKLVFLLNYVTAGPIISTTVRKHSGCFCASSEALSSVRDTSLPSLDFVMKHKQFIPTTLRPKCLTGQRSASTMLYTQLKDTARCTKITHFVDPPIGGIGARIMAMVKPLQLCLHRYGWEHCAVNFSPLPFYTYRCKNKDFTCFFLPLNTCAQKCQDPKIYHHIGSWHSLVSLTNEPTISGVCKYSQNTLEQWVSYKESFKHHGKQACICKN